nr:immunoglobulin heavy chain junction region [Mus musculus]MBK4198399.1 immunoglobulin heavy chain junction region [Mus musculus]
CATPGLGQFYYYAMDYW